MGDLKIGKLVGYLIEMQVEIREDAMYELAFDVCASDPSDDLEQIEGWIERLMKIESAEPVVDPKSLLQEMLASKLLDEDNLNPEDEWTPYVAGRRVLHLVRSFLKGEKS